MSPLYDMKCYDCGLESELFSTIAESNNQRCTCGSMLQKIFKSFNGFVDRNLGYYDRQLGVYIESTQHHRKIMKERGLEGVHSIFDIKQKSEQQQMSERKEEIKKDILTASRKRRGAI